jgi:hypothetical protein
VEHDAVSIGGRNLLAPQFVSAVYKNVNMLELFITLEKIRFWSDMTPRSSANIQRRLAGACYLHIWV